MSRAEACRWPCGPLVQPGGRCYIRDSGRRCGAGPFSEMRKVQQILALAAGVMGAALVVYGASGGLWPLTLQFVAGCLLVGYAVLRWRTL